MCMAMRSRGLNTAKELTLANKLFLVSAGLRSCLMDAKDNMALVMHEFPPPEDSIFKDASQREIGRRSHDWRKYIIFGIVIAVYFIVTIPLVTWFARKSGKI